MGSILSWGIKILHTMQRSQKAKSLLSLFVFLTTSVCLYILIVFNNHCPWIRNNQNDCGMLHVIRAMKLADPTTLVGFHRLKI